jgi:hypothetical protein
VRCGTDAAASIAPPHAARRVLAPSDAPTWRALVARGQRATEIFEDAIVEQADEGGGPPAQRCEKKRHWSPDGWSADRWAPEGRSPDRRSPLLPTLVGGCEKSVTLLCSQSVVDADLRELVAKEDVWAHRT